ncbi:MAG: hypothetical protein M3Y24_13250, partial [Acidobacteriota bacterium]|nr:hypothetical protein [Acidobacteriota bacterium]
SDLKPIELNSASSSMADHRCDESSTGYSLTGCSPAEPVSASPIPHSLSLYPAAVHSSAANGYLSLFSLSQRKGAFQSVPGFSLGFYPSITHPILVVESRELPKPEPLMRTGLFDVR